MNDTRTPLSPERAARRAKERADLDLIGKIADRAVREDLLPQEKRTDLVIALIQALRVRPLNLCRLLDFPLHDFNHDVSLLRHDPLDTAVARCES